MNRQPHSRDQVLIIESDPNDLNEIATTLDQAGYECQCATSGEAAHKVVQVVEPDLIVCDLQVDHGMGLDLCRELQQTPGLEGVPLMFLSATQSPDVIRRVRDVGGAYYLRKPIDPYVLTELVDKALWMPHLVSSHLGQHQPPAPLSGIIIPPVSHLNAPRAHTIASDLTRPR